MAGNLHVIENDQQFNNELGNAGAKLVVVDFFATWCGPCKVIAPVYESYASTYSKAVFLKVDVDICKNIAERYNITAMPTFVFIRNREKIDSMKGANSETLKEMISKHCTDVDEVESLVKGYIDLNSFINSSGSECLNESDEHTFNHAIKPGPGYLESDCDGQLIIALTFNQAVKVHSLRIDAPKENGPKTVKLFINQINTIDFDQAERMTPLQELVLTEDDLADSNVTSLKFVKFQNVQNITVFIKDNQSGSESTQIDHFSFIGIPLNTTNMSEFKRVAGKKGESH